MHSITYRLIESFQSRRHPATHSTNQPNSTTVEQYWGQINSVAIASLYWLPGLLPHSIVAIDSVDCSTMLTLQSVSQSAIPSILKL